MTEREDDAARRAYWIEQMEAAYAFMDTMKSYPVEECGERIASLRDAAEDAAVEVVFAGGKLGDEFDRLFYLREGLIASYVAVARAMNERGWILKVEDGYRTRAMQRALTIRPATFRSILRQVRWELSGGRPTPELMLRRVTALVATCPKIGTHMSASAMDISLLRRDDGAPIERGGPYITMSEVTPMASPFISPDERRDRGAITALMAAHGFRAYPYEFWHYSQGDAYAEFLDITGKPGRYGAVDADMSTCEVSPIEDPTALLCSLDEVRAGIDEALAEEG